MQQSNIFKFCILLLHINLVAIDYNHEISIVSSTNQYPLLNEVKNLALNANNYLNYSYYFDTKFIRNNFKTQNEIYKDPTHKEIIITTKDQQELTCSFFDRKKNKVIIIGPGLTNSKEIMLPFVHMFLNYDIVLMNFRGHGIKKNFIANPLYHALGVDLNVGFGAKEDIDTFAVVEHIRAVKDYDQVIGLGVCLGAFVFAKTQGIAQSQNLKCFDKLILDGCWPSLEEVSQKVENDPALIINPQRGGAPKQLRWLFKNFIYKALKPVIEKFLGKNLHEIELLSYIEKIRDTPILFFYGKDDLTITRSEFEQVWNKVKHPNKLAIITSNPHVHNHLKSKEVYKLISELFIENNVSTTVELLNDVKKLKSNILTNIYKQLQSPITNELRRKPEQKNNTSFIQNIKKPAILLGILLTAYKLGKINKETISNTLALYAALYVMNKI